MDSYISHLSLHRMIELVVLGIRSGSHGGGVSSERDCTNTASRISYPIFFEASPPPKPNRPRDGGGRCASTRGGGRDGSHLGVAAATDVLRKGKQTTALRMADQEETQKQSWRWRWQSWIAVSRSSW